MIHVTVLSNFIQLFDWDIVKLIQKGLLQLFSQSETEFYFWIPESKITEPFTRAFVHTIRFMRDKYPAKRITIMLSRKPGQRIHDSYFRLPCKMVEDYTRLLHAVCKPEYEQCKKEKRDPFSLVGLFDETYEMQDDVITKADVIFLYTYPHLLSSNVKCNFGDKQVISCTSTATEKRILQAIKELPEQKRMILQGQIAGKTTKQLASEFGCHTSKIRYHSARAKAMVVHQLSIMQISRNDMRHCWYW